MKQKNIAQIHQAATNRFDVPKWLAVGVLAGALIVGTGWVNAQQDLGSVLSQANQMMASGRQAEALQLVEGVLQSNSRDPQLRFTQGVILSSMGRADDAIAVFESLATEFPELPEPYNNLAVLYAAKGNYDQARIKLEMAIRTNPTYATAHDNLGDVYTKLAGQSYEKALQIDNGNPAVRSKLMLLNQMTKPGTGSNVAPQAPMPMPMPPADQAPRMETPQAIDQTPVANVGAPELPISSNVAAGGAGSPLGSVKAWANAWSEQNVAQYLSYYAPNFRVPGGNRGAWEAERRARIAGKSKITVTVYEPKVKMQGNRAIVSFSQGYRSPSFSSTTRKTLVLENNGGNWQIVEERAN